MINYYVLRVFRSLASNISQRPMIQLSTRVMQLEKLMTFRFLGNCASQTATGVLTVKVDDV